jgi:membrane protein DedA with SNARE-associated domain
VRQYVSLPAGLVRMNMARFLFYTGLGAGLWVSVLAWIGYIAGQSEALWRPYLKRATVAALVFCVVVVAVYVLVRRARGKKSDAA